MSARLWRVGLWHWLVHKFGWQKVRLIRAISSDGKERLMTECVTCGSKKFLCMSTVKAVGFLLSILSCAPTSPPPATAQTVYTELVIGGCLSATPDGLQAVTDEHSDSEQPAWMACLFDGGSIQTCNVPCQ